MFGRILVAVDGSDSNRVAVDRAIALAKQFGSELTAICVFDLGSYGFTTLSAPVEDTGVQDLFDYALGYARSRAEEEGITLGEMTVTGRPADCIVDASRDFDLVVCATLGRTGIKRALMGSVAETVVRLAHCPVLVVRE